MHAKKKDCRASSDRLHNAVNFPEYYIVGDSDEKAALNTMNPLLRLLVRKMAVNDSDVVPEAAGLRLIEIFGSAAGIKRSIVRT